MSAVVINMQGNPFEYTPSPVSDGLMPLHTFVRFKRGGWLHEGAIRGRGQSWLTGRIYDVRVGDSITGQYFINIPEAQLTVIAEKIASHD